MVIRHKTRYAFTLVELIVVIGIITVLAAFGLGAASKGYGWMQQRATETTMKKVLFRINTRVMTLLGKEADEWPTPDPIRAQAADNAARARALKIEYLYRWSFPTSYAEAMYNVLESRVYYASISNVGYPRAVNILSKLQSKVLAASWTAAYTTTDPEYLRFQNAVCLAASYESAPDSSKDELNASELVQAPVTYVGSDANTGLADSWGKPMFYLRYGVSDPLIMPTVNGRWTIFFPNAFTSQMPPLVAPTGPVPLQTVLAAATLGELQNEFIARSRVGIAGRTSNASAAVSFSDPETVLNLGNWPTLTAYSTFWPEGVAGSPSFTNFARTFGYSIGSTINYAPMGIYSSGADKNFTTWNDNLDSYRLQSSVSGQQ